MEQTRKRRLNNRKSGPSQCKVPRLEGSEDFTVLESRDGTDIKGSCRRFTKIRASSPHSDTGQEQRATCTQTPEEDAEKNLVITFDKEQGGTRQVGRRKGLRRKRETAGDADAQQKAGEVQPEVEIDQDLDRELENKSRQHNLTSANVRSIIHEVITNEHVVAMMKAAINEMEPVPVFEPKMTRSKLKEVVEKGVVIPAWNISPIKKPTEIKKGPQFVDIPLEEEDSSDEEYQPDEEEEDETAEETLLESDLESSVSSPRGTRVKLHRSYSEHEDDRSSSFRRSLHRSRHLTVAVTPMGPPPPPPAPECSFLEKLHAVDEELAIGPDCMDSYQSLSSSNGDESLISFRTRSKRPLRNVPLGRLEAELRAPDITPDMYEFGSAPEDREWTQWLQGLMISDVENEEEGDDEDDPEYNFLAEIDEPDVEDYRNDKAVRITKKEVNDLLEELFDAFQDELCGQDEEGHEEEEEKEEEETPTQETPTILENIHCEDPFADVLKQRYRTVREQLAALRKREALLKSKGVSVPSPCPQRPSSSFTPVILSATQKLQLQQQIQQHVQLLTQVNMLSSSVKGLETEASTSKQFLLELQMFAQHGEQARVPLEPSFTSIFRGCNLQGALSLLEELMQSHRGDPSQRFSGSQFPAHLAWLMVTRPVFLYSELLPVVQLRPSRFKRPFTSAEDCLLVLGHKHMRSTLHPLQMVCRYLLAARSFLCVKAHIREACQKPFDNVIKTYFVAGKCSLMPLACKRVSSCDQRPPVEREQSLMPDWLSKNLKLIYEHVRKFNQPSSHSQSLTVPSAKSLTSTEKTNEYLSASPGPQCSFPSGTFYPPYLPKDLSEILKPNLNHKKRNHGKSIKPSKPALTAEELEEALSHLPAILPKATTVTNPLLPCPPHLPQSINPAIQTASQRPEVNPCFSGSGPMNCSAERPIIVSTVSKVPSVGHGGVTFPTPPVTTELSSLGTVPVRNTVEATAGLSGDPKVAQVGTTQGKVIITLPAAVMTPQMSSHPLRHLTVNEASPAVASNVATAVPAGPNQGGLIITLPSSPVCSPICATPVIKTPSASVSLNTDYVNQRYGTLLKLIPKYAEGLTSESPSGSQNPHNQFLLLPPGYVFAGYSQIAKPRPTSKRVLLPKGTVVKLNTTKGTVDGPQNTMDGPQKGPPEMSSIQETLIDCIQETSKKGLTGTNDGREVVENEVEDCEQRDSTDLFLTLSESSGSPKPSIEVDDIDMEMVSDREVMGEENLEKQKAKERRGTYGQISEKPGGINHVSEVLLVPELQEAMEKFSQLATKTQSEMEENLDSGQSSHKPLGENHDHADLKTPSVLYSDTLGDDPHRDAKDVAFAQAYLQKVYEVLQADPEKLEEFLGVLSEFEKDPESHTSLELLTRLKPVLIHWPELLRDFAAFLHPNEAQECGLMVEQQAFERSRRFLRQLEHTFGEHSDLYRKVVHILHAGPSDLAGSKEIKAQIKLLFCDNTNLLEEFWVFFKQLHPQLQSDEDDNDTDSVSSVETIQELDGSQQANHQPIRTLPADKNNDIKCKKHKHVQMKDERMHSAKNTVYAELENKACEDSSVDIKQQTNTETSVCAENISHTPNGKKVVLWTREADRVILTTCQRKGAKMATFCAIADQLGNKTAAEVSERFQDLIKLFHRSCKLHHSP